MFEKSLYDLIRGLRNHKGNERAYLQDSIRECRREIKTQDMDTKATALLKLTYLEMFGHDMSWASFNVLEVMSSQKYAQKRVGYLGAVQSFRPDTEVLMLAENQLKKDLSSPLPPTISLPLVTIPHVISAPMANSLLSDLLPRLSHSHAIIRKKTIATLYRLALVYPETLRPAWPKLKERLLDESEDPGVTAAVINVVCELGWRRPQDFLPLAPRLFDLLVEGGNNWMAIKIIKLFAILTPLEPRLVKKLLPPLTTLIKTTPAMSLLYECINSIISGGILTNASGSTEGDEIARLCVSKLRGMLVIEGDPNLKYVALLAFNRIVELHPYLVSLHEDVILECMDDPDISIRLRALDLAAGMINAQNLSSIVDRLITQLQTSSSTHPSDDVMNDRAVSNGVEPSADSDEEGSAQAIRPQEQKSNQTPQLPDDYKTGIIRKVIEMCSQNTYGFVNDFDWYLDCLLKLVRHVPAASNSTNAVNDISGSDHEDYNEGVAYEIGAELRNVAVRVKSSRGQAVRVAEALLSVNGRSQLFPQNGSDGQAVLGPVAWVIGEFPQYLADPQACLDSLLHPDSTTLPSRILVVYIQASVKLCALIASDQQQLWTGERKTTMTLLMSRIIHFLDGLTTHPDLETQETAVQFLELLRLASEAVVSHTTDANNEDAAEAPLLLTQAMPSLFSGAELNPVAKDAQRKVPLPAEIDLDRPINEHLSTLLNVVDATNNVQEDPDFYDYYYKRPEPKTVAEPAANRLQPPEEPLSYQRGGADYLEPELVARRRAEREAQHKDDPFYISGQGRSGAATPVHEILRSNNGEELDVDSIPIMELDLGTNDSDTKPLHLLMQKEQKNPQRSFEILGDENLDQTPQSGVAATQPKRPDGTALGKSLLQVDSSGLGGLSLNEHAQRREGKSQLDVERQEAEEAEMARAMKEVERLRLEMQRAQERIQSKEESTVVKKKKKKKATTTEEIDSGLHDAEKSMFAGANNLTNTGFGEEAEHTSKKKKKKKIREGVDDAASGEAVTSMKPKKKKKRREINLDDSLNT